MLLAVVGVASVTRTITDSGDNVETFIRNSNGNYWGATGSNIQTAIDDLGTGGTVYLPAGTFTITSRIEPTNNIYLKGSGIGNTVIESNSNLYVIWLAPRSNVTISDLTINMHSTGEHAIRIADDSEDIILENLQILNPGGNGIYVSSAKRLFVSNVHVHDISKYDRHGIGVRYVEDSVFSGCIITRKTNVGYGVDVSKVRNCTFNNFVIKDCQYGMKVTGTSIDNTYNCQFNNFYISNIEQTALRVDESHYCNFNNINIEDGGTNGINIYSNCSNLNLNNIYINNTSNVGLNVRGESINVNNVIVRNPGSYGLGINGNGITLSNSQIYASAVYNRLSNSEDITISNCIFKDGSDYGLLIRSSNNFIISNCQIIDNANPGLWIEGDQGICTNFLIEGCVIRGNSLGIYIDSEAHDHFIVTHNILTDNVGDNLSDNSLGMNKIVSDNIE